jgi:cell division protein FtsQ
MWDDAQQLTAIAAGLALLAVALLGYGAVRWITQLPVFEFRAVGVEAALERADPRHLEAVIREELAGTFFTMNLDRARAALERVPWVRRVALRRQWPQRLELSVEEHVPLARWNATALVNVEGEVFAADHDGELPQFEGPEGRSGEMTARYREWNEALASLDMAIETRGCRRAAGTSAPGRGGCWAWSSAATNTRRASRASWQHTAAR